MQFKHFLFTRVNIGYIERAGALGIVSRDWLQDRLALFYHYCLPSVVNQSNKNFTWLLYFDRRTPQDVIATVEEKLVGLDFIELSFKAESFGLLRESVIRDVSIRLKNNTTHIITSRLDTDDMIHVDFIDSVQRLFQGQKYLPINFDKGYQYDN